MIKTNKSKLRILSLLVAAVLILACLPLGALAESFSAAVKVKSMKVYGDANGRTYLGSLRKKTIVTVEEYADGVAKIRYKGVTGYVKTSNLRAVESFAKRASTNAATRVYQEPDASSPSAKVKAGVEVYVLAVSGGVAMVERDGIVGYMQAKHLTLEGQKPEEETEKPSKLPEEIADKLPEDVVDQIENGELSQNQLEALKEALEAQAKQEEEEKEQEESKPTTIEQAFSSGKYSNEQLCFAFATKVMGYNKAAAAGLLSNISAESGFRVNANGDSGRSYGICQWFSARKTRLLNWCESKGLDSASLIGQLYFLKYELETYYPSVHRYMKNVDDTAEGAYDAAYYFCYNFEAPANRASKSTSRGNSAKNIFYPRYAGTSI